MIHISLTDQEYGELCNVLKSLRVARACLVSPELGQNTDTARTMVQASETTLDNILKKVMER